MAKCGCKPCSQPIVDKKKGCKPFSMCVGNNTLVFDGECLSVIKRKYTIPNGTYTSITFEDGCITGVGNAPIPVYTPQACCDGEGSSDNTTGTGSTTGSITAARGRKNLAVMNNGSISVEPQWGNSGIITVGGDGTVDKPWLPKLKISKGKGNRLEEKNDGLYAGINFGTSDNVEITGTGTELDPWKFNIKGADAKLPEINKETTVGNGFEIDKEGRIKTEGEVNFVTNLEFTSDAFTVLNAGEKTQIVVNEQKLRTGSNLAVESPLMGKGTTDDPLKLTIDETLVMKVLEVIENSAAFKAKLKAMLGE